MIATADDLIDALGGTKATAEIAGVVPSAVSNWRKSGKIPPRLYLKFAAAGRSAGVQVPEALFCEITSIEPPASSEAAA